MAPSYSTNWLPQWDLTVWQLALLLPLLAHYAYYAFRGERGRAGPAPMAESAGFDGATQSSAPSSGLQDVTSIRQEFPETWIWAESFIGYLMIF